MKAMSLSLATQMKSRIHSYVESKKAPHSCLATCRIDSVSGGSDKGDNDDTEWILVIYVHMIAIGISRNQSFSTAKVF